MSLGDELAGVTSEGSFAVDAEQVERASADRVENPWMPLSGADLPQDRVGGVGTPGDRPVRLAHQPPGATDRRRLGTAVLAVAAVEDPAYRF